MTDFEMTRLCAEAMGMQEEIDEGGNYYDVEGSLRSYWPIADDAQALALVKDQRLSINSFHGAALLDHERQWEVEFNDGNQSTITKNAGLNRAIVECVAKMQKAKP